ncbi:P-loop containing nucleoside triphosphate hydrolase protein [Westerdykella ornata]|uniref:P-loop containing nucleoside triphosphate hydrolase protein n=1 Tax=Westerdykella ornata TaxID=318751 RepID=A0A6A6JKU3_WESOR|nr:P-loop containing nucleoside triphosphate hydrolase protein [Westerdykella ornata]KAF2277137.1 P-loop containing nucleoside triphosphate hydrolase protein [Westerdykella ornata]
MRFNVKFPLKQPLLQAQWDALSCIHLQLQKIHEEQYQYRETHSPGSQAPSGGQSSNREARPRNDWIRRMTFPDESDGAIQRRLRQLAHSRGLFDAQCNYEQLQAVNSACEADFGVLPFLISGPPGTGKTKTLVEIALQLLNTTDVAHILICAPSDQAADTLALRLRQHLSPEKLLRLNGPQRADNEVPGELLGYCYRDRDMFYLPPISRLMKYNIVVTSTRDAAILANARVTNADLYLIEKNMHSAFHPEDENTGPTRLRWGALLLDEAAQATELDVMPALTVVMPPSQYPANLQQPRLIMAGDQEQLGPRTASNDPRCSRSLFARLFERPLYKTHPLSRNRVRASVEPPVLNSSMLPMLYPPFANLMRNYRSHPAILTVPSCLFYNDTLIPEAPIETNTPLQASSIWQGKKYPVLYVPITSLDDIEYEGGGWYNNFECQTACAIAARLVTEAQVPQREVAIISPFAAQVKRLRNLMRSPTYSLWDVNIGPLEAFQGLESRVVILCTTRTRERFLAEDIQRGVGIIGLRRKMNVALTRAKAGLVVLGNPNVLALDEHWKAFLAFCHRNGDGEGLRVV